MLKKIVSDFIYPRACTDGALSRLQSMAYAKTNVARALKCLHSTDAKAWFAYWIEEHPSQLERGIAW